MFDFPKILSYLVLAATIKARLASDFLSPGPVISANRRQGYFSVGPDAFFEKIENLTDEIKLLTSSYSIAFDRNVALKRYSDIILGLAAQDELYNCVFNITKADLLSKRLYKTSEHDSGLWLSSIEAQFHRITTKKKLVDVTDRQGDVQPLSKKKSKIPSKPEFQEYAEPILKTLDPEEMKKFLTKFSSFYNRYYNSHYGVESAQFLFDKLQAIINESHRKDLTVQYFPHNWKQSSIIVRFKPDNKTDEIVVVGAHQDSVSQWNPWFGRAPGADDDGSGTTSILSAFKALVQGGFRPTRNLEFHWYSGEEGGLKGSEAIASKYASSHKNVVAMMHFDMSGHFVGPERIAVVQDHTDPTLSEFLRKLIIAYTDLKWINSGCGYGCSDHASWDSHGYRAAFPIEDPDIDSNPNIHSSRDRVETINFHHVKQFARLATAFAIELST
ncbi:hypothetical protein DSO57_1018071 [Entomophthora muscae]|uniref:Uncharacterized protein n=1 Tax=Entomophthora muscae TaxID=34485 RepID=A0ACC2S6I4_9FUNG|nr:hypothetical protein DSO57_1018071 [Entomophthora muscae]